ncbi:MAG: hypothetical protein GYB67_16435, partial [Chloroflexi bacterium]|nr:hypothetical protein [Chloroflexota bacterium]
AHQEPPPPPPEPDPPRDQKSAGSRGPHIDEPPIPPGETPIFRKLPNMRRRLPFMPPPPPKDDAESDDDNR